MLGMLASSFCQIMFFLSFNLIYVIPKKKLRNKNKQNPKESHHRALKDLQHADIETLWFGF